jgi:hypothetical protein
MKSAPLSAAARRQLELGSHVEPPTAEQNDRMDRALAELFRAGRAGPAPATGSSLGGAEQHAAGPRAETGQGSDHGPGSKHRWNSGSSGARLQTAPRVAGGLREPLRAVREAKLWLTVGALAATASASFWLGRLSTPADDARPQEARTIESSLLERGLAPPASGEQPLAHARSTLPVLDLSASTAPGTASTETASVEPPVGDVAVRDVPGPSDASRARGNPGVARNEPGSRRSGTPAQRPLGLAAEIEQLTRAEAALRQGRAGHALAVLDQRSVRHLLEQAAALRAIAQCELRGAAAAGGARQVLERWPASAFQPRIANACGL